MEEYVHTQKEGQQESLLGVGAGSTGDFVSTLSPNETQNEVAGLVHVLSTQPHDWPSGSPCISSVRLCRQEAAQKIKTHEQSCHSPLMTLCHLQALHQLFSRESLSNSCRTENTNWQALAQNAIIYFDSTLQLPRVPKLRRICCLRRCWR